MEDLLKNQQKIMFSGSGASHKNGAADCITKMLVTMEITMLMHDALICPKYTLHTAFGQWKWTMLYGSKVGSLICSMVYKLLGKFGIHMFGSQVFRSLE